MSRWRDRLGADVRVLAAGGYVPAPAPRRAVKGVLAALVRVVDRRERPLDPLLRPGAAARERAEEEAFDVAVAARLDRLSRR